MKTATLNIRITPETMALIKRLQVAQGGKRISQSDIVALSLAHLALDWSVGVSDG